MYDQVEFFRSLYAEERERLELARFAADVTRVWTDNLH